MLRQEVRLCCVWLTQVIAWHLGVERWPFTDGLTLGKLVLLRPGQTHTSANRTDIEHSITFTNSIMVREHE
ncbi:MAG: hypothetical protein ACI89J_000033 [Hyphomicrobiaceae bacterium]|jgi:hypothetical protein